MMLSDNWAELLVPGLRGIFEAHRKQFNDYIPMLFNVETSTRAYEEFLGVGELGLMEEWESSGRKVSYEDFEKGFKATFHHKKYSKGITIERELVDDDQYAEIKKRVKKLARVAFLTRQVHAASVFNNAFSDAYYGPDRKALCSNAHPIIPDASTTWSNYSAYELNATNVELVRTNAANWVDDKGNPVLTQFDTLIVPPALRKTALIIAETDEEPFTTEHGINVWKGQLNVIEHPFLTDSTAWFMMDKARAKEELLWFDRRKPDFADKVEFDDETAKYKVVGRWSFGWLTPFFIYGCKP